MHTTWTTFIIVNLLASVTSYSTSIQTTRRTHGHHNFHHPITSILSAATKRMGNTNTMDASTATSNNMKLPLHTFYSPFLSHHHDDDNDNAQSGNSISTDNSSTLLNQDPPNKILNALIILNSPIHNPPSPIFTKLWNISSIRICADGGANRLHRATVSVNAVDTADEADSKECDSAKGSSEDNGSSISTSNSYIPDLIRGDLDSLAPHVRKHYEERGVSVERDGDQNCNDLDKALSTVRKLLQTKDCTKGKQEEQTVQIYVYGAFGGRFDQEMASIQALYKWKDEFNYRIALYNDETCAMLLRPHARNEVYLPFYSKGRDEIESQGDDNDNGSDANMMSVGEGPTCGLIPIGCLCDGVETEGFKWDLDGSVPLEFGGLVSTSNRAEEPVLVVQCNQPLVFTAEIIQS